MAQELSLLDLDEKKIELLKRTVARGATTDEFELFLLICKRTELDPFAKQIYLIKRRVYNEALKKYEDVATFQTAIDGARLVAQRTGEYEGQAGPEWCGDDGVWKDVWLDTKRPPFAARVGVYRKGFRQPTWGVCRWKGFAQWFKKDNEWKLGQFWEKNPDAQLAKCAEMQALRKSFPQELGSLFMEEELGGNQYDLEEATDEVGGTEYKLTTPPSDYEKGIQDKNTAHVVKKDYDTLTKKAKGLGVDLKTFFPTPLAVFKTAYENKDWGKAANALVALEKDLAKVKPVTPLPADKPAQDLFGGEK